MIDKIFNLFFCKTLPHRNKRVTVLRDREMIIVPSTNIRNEIKKTESETCLSKYFKDIKGLNVKERTFAEFNR